MLLISLIVMLYWCNNRQQIIGMRLVYRHVSKIYVHKARGIKHVWELEIKVCLRADQVNWRRCLGFGGMVCRRAEPSNI